jgi:hypothetical protein
MFGSFICSGRSLLLKSKGAMDELPDPLLRFTNSFAVSPNALSKRKTRDSKNRGWVFAARFRPGAFGWRSQPAVRRIKEAVLEIRTAAKSDVVFAAEGAILFIERLSAAIEHVDGSSGSIGAAVNNALDALIPIIAAAPVPNETRDMWLDWLWKAFENDRIPYIERLGDRWGELCVTAQRASRWANDLLPGLLASWSDRQSRSYFKGTTACLSCLLAANRLQELLDVLEKAPFVWWDQRTYGVRALAAMGRIDEATAYAESSLGTNDSPVGMAKIVEEMLLAAGRREEAYARYAILANQGSNRLLTFRAIADKYPNIEPAEILLDLIQSTPGEEGKWFATAKELGQYDFALKLAEESPCDPKTLNRAARDYADSRPEFARDVALASLWWLAQGHGYDVTEYDARDAYQYAMQAAKALGHVDEIQRRVEEIIAQDRTPGRLVERALHRECA